jgi:hypothetical protein
LLRPEPIRRGVTKEEILDALRSTDCEKHDAMIERIEKEGIL